MAFSDPQHNIEQFNLEKGMHVADLGSGSGFYTIAAAKAVGENGKVYAVDVQKDLLEKVKNDASKLALHNIDIIWGDIEKIGGTKLKDASVDAVIASNILFQMPDKEEMAKEARRILKFKGRILVIDWSDSSLGLGPRVEDLFLAPAAKTLFENAGFSYEGRVDAGDHHYGMILRK